MPSSPHTHTHTYMYMCLCMHRQIQSLLIFFCFLFLLGCCAGDGDRRRSLGQSCEEAYSERRDRLDVQLALKSFLSHPLWVHLPMAKAKRAATCRPHNGGQAGGGGGWGGHLPFVFERSNAVQKGGERAILFRCQGGGEHACFHSAGQFTHHMSLSTTRVHKSMHRMWMLTHT